MRPRVVLQQQFIDRCLHTDKTLDQVMQELNILPAQVAHWLTTRGFRQRLTHARRHARRMRELQIELGAWRAAQVLVRAAVSDEATVTPVVRQACADLIKLARDTRARSIQHRAPTAGRSAPRIHPDLDPAEQSELARHLTEEGA